MCVFKFVVITVILLYGSLNFWSFMFVFNSFMASTFIIPPVSEMVELRPHGIGVPIFFPIDAHGIVVVSSLHLSITFSLKVSTIRVEHEIFHPDTRLLVQTLNDTSKLTENGHVVWELGPTKHRVYGLPDSHIQFPLCVLPLILDFPNHVFF